MSSTTKKKHVTREVLEEYPLPEEELQIVKVLAARGNNLHEVETASSEKFLVTMPSKFRKHVWIKRGDFIMVEPIEEGNKVKGQITHILFKEQIKHIQDQGLWPEIFSDNLPKQSDNMVPDDLLPPSDSEDSDTDLGDLVINVNRGPATDQPSEEESSEDEEEVEHAPPSDSDESTDDDEAREAQYRILKARIMASKALQRRNPQPKLDLVNNPGLDNLLIESLSAVELNSDKEKG